MRPHAVLPLLVAAALVPSEASADPSFGASVHLGLGTPPGLVGVTAEMTVAERMRFDLGGGLGAAGPQGSLMAVVLLGDARQFGAGVGVSAGPYDWVEGGGLFCDFCDERTWDLATWVNVQLEWRAQLGAFHVGPYAGLGLLVHGDSECPPGAEICGEGSDGERLYFIGLAFGYSPD